MGACERIAAPTSAVQTSAMDIEDAFAHQHDTCVNSAQPVDSVPVSHAPDAVCGQGDQTTTSESTPDRMLLTCASPGCQFRVHSSPKYGDFCCIACRLGGAARHGPACERIAAPTNTEYYLEHDESGEACGNEGNEQGQQSGQEHGQGNEADAEYNEAWSEDHTNGEHSGENTGSKKEWEGAWETRASEQEQEVADEVCQSMLLSEWSFPEEGEL